MMIVVSNLCFRTMWNGWPNMEINLDIRMDDICLKIHEFVVLSPAKNYYRPHPKDGEGTVFSLFVSPYLGGTPGLGLNSMCKSILIHYQTLCKSKHFPEFHGAEGFIRSSSQEESSFAS